MPRKFTAECDCCGMQQLFTDNTDYLHPGSGRVCSRCRLHRGEAEWQQLRRALQHEEWLRERLAEARAAAQKAEEERDDYRERMLAALRSRDKGVRLLQRLNDLHALRPNGNCACGVKRGCGSGELLQQRWAQQMIGRVDAEDDRRQRMQELGIFDDADAWVTDALPEQPRRSDTA